MLEHRSRTEVRELVVRGEFLVPRLVVVVMEEDDVRERVVVVDDIGQICHGFISLVDWNRQGGAGASRLGALLLAGALFDSVGYVDVWFPMGSLERGIEPREV